VARWRENGLQALLPLLVLSPTLLASSRISDRAASPPSFCPCPAFLIPLATALKKASCPTFSLCLDMISSIFFFSSSILFLLSSNFILTDRSWPSISSSVKLGEMPLDLEGVPGPLLLCCSLMLPLLDFEKSSFSSEKVMLMPLELRPRVAKDVFFSFSIVSSSILSCGKGFRDFENE